MAERKPQRTRAVADRAESIQRTKYRAGKAAAKTAIERRKQNKGVKDGTIKLGKGGRTYNVYDAISGTWKRGIVKRAETAKRPATPRGGTRKEADMVRRPTFTQPSYGAEYVVGRGRTMPRPNQKKK